MAIECSQVPTTNPHDCTNPWGENCTSNTHFHFPDLWKYTQNIQQACATDHRLFIPNGTNASPQNASLTQVSCAAIAGWDWTSYAAADIWTRLTTWKFPLLQLVASFPRPPLSFWVEWFVIVHVLGDPIDTIKNSLAKMARCQGAAEYWIAESGKLLERRVEEDEDRDWKALALITDAYGEWGEDSSAKVALERGLRGNPVHRTALASAVRQTGRALAADRSTKFLPIIVAQTFFIGAVAIAVFRTASAAGASASSGTIFINVEAHSIAFSALYFWIIPAVWLSSVIGVSQTEAAIPRILRRFQTDIEHLNLPNQLELPNASLNDIQKRIFHGGVYSWQPQEWPLSHTSLLNDNVLPNLIMIVGTVTGMAVSALVPPDGWDCRHIGEISIFLTWFMSAQVDVLLVYLWPLKTNNQNKLFWTTNIKDLVATVLTMGGIAITQIGIFNRCSCYTRWGRTGLALPEMPEVSKILFHRIKTVYPAIAFTGIGIELIVVPLFICIQYKDALRTFVQRDDRKSNAAWLWKTVKLYRGLKARLQAALPWNHLSPFKPRRTDTSAVERGALDESQEMQPLTQSIQEEPEGMVTGYIGVREPFVTDEQSKPMPPTEPTSHSNGGGSPYGSESQVRSIQAQ